MSESHCNVVTRSTPWTTIAAVVAVSVMVGTAGAQCVRFADDVGFTTGGTASDVTLSDFNGDAAPDAAVINSDGTVAILLNDGAGAFSGPGMSVLPLAIGEVLTDIVSADFDNDGDVDLAVVGLNVQVTLLFNQGDGSFGAPVDTGQPGFVFAPALETSDMDNDGDTDLIVNVPSVVLVNDGAGNFPTSVPYPGFAPNATVAVGDLDGNGLTDIVTTSFDFGTMVTFNFGKAGFQVGPVLPSGPSVLAVRVADLNGDAMNDVVVANSVGGLGDPAGATGRVTVFINVGGGAFAGPMSFDVGDNPRRLAVGDLDGNGTIDLVASNTESHSLSVLLGDGDGSFASDVMLGNDPGTVAIGDLDLDGRQDIAFTAGGLGIIFNRTPRQGDVDGDGDVDIDDIVTVILNFGS